jgi:hypothetical protein
MFLGRTCGAGALPDQRDDTEPRQRRPRLWPPSADSDASGALLKIAG